MVWFLWYPDSKKARRIRTGQLLVDGLCWGGVEPGHTYEIGDRSPLQTLSFALCLLDHLFSDRGGNGKQGANKRFHG